jgi:hypothetical protein
MRKGEHLYMLTWLRLCAAAPKGEAAPLVTVGQIIIRTGTSISISMST